MQDEERILFTKEMRKTHTILLPNMLPVHFKILEKVFTNCGYHVCLLHNEGPQVVAEGLKYVHNDTCYPALLVIGQMIDALNSGKFDLQHTAVMITQTGGGCRASNYLFLLRKALQRAGYGRIPVVSLNLKGMEQNPGFRLTPSLIRKGIAGVVYGDLLMLLHNQIRPYELHSGDCDALRERWSNEIASMLNRGKGYTLHEMKPVLQQIVASYGEIPFEKRPRVKVGIVGEIYVKYCALANNHLEDFLASQGCEVMVPGLMGFLMYAIYNGIEDYHLYGGSFPSYQMHRMAVNYLASFEKLMLDAVREDSRFYAPAPFLETKELIHGVVGFGTKMGEGWLLTAEMLELAANGYSNIVCAQPFGCLPNHINGKGMIRPIRERHPEANIVPIDYDPSATKVNQENRIKLMLSVAREKIPNCDQSPIPPAPTEKNT